MDPMSAFTRGGDVHVLDVREAFEWKAGHIEGAQHIPMRQIPGRLDEVPGDRFLVAVCRSGHRSGEVTRFLSDKGFEVENLDGGMKAWARAGLPVVRPDGGQAKVV